ncbi:MAG TPA: DMT family transporter [Anaerolineales bacterium]|nr:DMT family transporter [Anaerolineales bacterium]
MNNYLGEFAALATSLFFTATSTQFTLAGRQVGSIVVNRTRLVLALIFLSLAHWLLRIPLPVDIGSTRWLWLGISGIVGLVIGDTFLFQAFVWIGPRLAMLLMSLSPILATIVAWLFLSEKLSPMEIIGILLTVAGIAWVILERNGTTGHGAANPNYLQGLLFGFGAAICQALGLIFAKKGLASDFPPLSGTLIRMLVAASVLWILTLFRRQALETYRQLNNHRQAVLLLLGGSFTGPFIGVTLSLFAVQQTEVGVASTLMALPPLFLLPVGHFIFNERLGLRAIAGTLIAVLGVAILFLV